MKRTALVLGITLAALAGITQPAQAQFLKKVKQAAERAAERETLRQVDKKVTNAVRCALEDQACIEKARAEGKEVEVIDAQGNVVSAAPAGTGAAATAATPGEGAWANYDFVPGERVLFYEDFEGERTGNFPRRLDHIGGNMEVVEWNGRKLLRATGKNSRFGIALPESLPERFTIEFEMHDAHGSEGVSVATVEPPNFGWAWNHKYPSSYFNAGHRGGSGVRTYQGYGPTSTAQDKTPHEQIRPIRIAVDGSYAKVYVGEKRVANVPNATINRSGKVYFFLEPLPSADKYVYVDNIRVAAGGRDMYDRLESEGRVATQGILFATGSDRIQPESTPTLKEIIAMLKQHGDLRLAIEGHTDNVGDDAANQRLSEERAAAVRQYLVQQGIDASRLEAKGLGESKPVASNDTLEGRQQNRRVELVRI